MNIKTDLTQLVGNTPMLELTGIQRKYDLKARIVAKLEYFNPLGSVKDRAALAMIEAAECEGKINQDTLLVEPTSGNTGVGLAFVCAVRGLRLILTMPDSMSAERRMLLAALGAEIRLTPGAEGMNGAIRVAEQICAENPNSFMPQQFDNPANPAIHELTTGEEIWRDTDGQADILVATFGSGGTITGAGRALRRHNPEIRIVGVEPETSAVASGQKPGPHKIQGIGPGFVPSVLDVSLMDEILPVSDANACARTAELALTEGLLLGISSGAALHAAIELAKRAEHAEKLIVVIFPDTGERYLSTGVFGRVSGLMHLQISETVRIPASALVLRGFCKSDVPDMLRNWISDPQVQGGYGEPAYTDPEAVAELVNKWATQWRWAVILRDTGENIGQIGFYPVHEAQRTGELEYCIGSAFQGNGYATLAIRAMMEYTFENTGIVAVEAWHRAENPGSGRVLLKAGFQRTDTILRPPPADRFQALCAAELQRIRTDGKSAAARRRAQRVRKPAKHRFTGSFA